MLRILRAFAWMRWRVLLNSLERTSARDTIERLSLAVEQLGPIMAAALLVPSTIALSGISAYGGYALARGDAASIAFEALRYIMLAATALAVVGPIMLPAAERTNAVRLLLLPIPRGVLYATQAAGAIADPWILLLLPIVIFLPVGLAVGGAFLAAIVALAGGLLFVAISIGLSSVTTTTVHFAVRDRRRGELLALLFILILPLLGILPGILQGDERRDRRHNRPPLPEVSLVPSWAEEAGRRAFASLPSELYTRGTRAMLERRRASGATAITGLVALAAGLHGVAWLLFSRLLDSPASVGPRRAGVSTATWGRTLPWLSPGASAVALAQVRLAIRTPRGRSTLLSPLIVTAMFATLMWRNREGMDLGFIALESGLGLATFGSFVCLLSILPLAMNQFAIDGAGLTLELLSPLSDEEILAGKAVGNALLCAGPALAAIVAAYLIFPSRPLSLWLSLPVGLCAIYVLVAPCAAILSSVFPRTVDLNSIGRGSNAHGVAGLLGMLAYVVGAGPPVLLVLLASRILERPDLAPVLLFVWLGIAYGISRLLFVPASKIFNKRRENLSFVV